MNTESNTKVCGRCGVERGISEYHKNKRTKDGLNIYCKSCYREYYKTWYANNKTEKIRSDVTRRKEHPERRKKWDDENRDRINYLSRVHYSNGDYIESYKKKLAVRRGATKNSDIWLEMAKKNQDYKCNMCGKKEPDIKLTIDHIVPLSMGGIHSLLNIQALCVGCNSSKKDRMLPSSAYIIAPAIL